MKIIYSNQDIPDNLDGHSLFLVGPTPRERNVSSWRPEALSILDDFKYNGTVFVPEWENWDTQCDFEDQVEWEWKGLDISTSIAAWIPRKSPEMPAFTSNVEFGLYVDSEKFFYGRPFWAEKCKYLDALYYKKRNRLPVMELKDLLQEAIAYGN